MSNQILEPTEILSKIVEQSIEEGKNYSILDMRNGLYNITVKTEFWINMFLKHKDSKLFELLEVYPEGSYGLSIYVQYKGE